MTTMLIQPTSTNTTSRDTSARTSQTAGNFDAFLQLLVTQLKNQDPMKPLDPTQTVTQLATFANVEQAVHTNSLLATLRDNASLSQASALLGRTVASPDDATKGIVDSVTLSDRGMIAHLKDGRDLALVPGVSIS
ncbi:MAG: flagellar biosynthesis protein FlgD [Methylocystis sp.]|nr:MAG: flagellar biosynthesis protein FlgD [Methylocystis sp.]